MLNKNTGKNTEIPIMPHAQLSGLNRNNKLAAAINKLLTIEDITTITIRTQLIRVNTPRLKRMNANPVTQLPAAAVPSLQLNPYLNAP